MYAKPLSPAERGSCFARKPVIYHKTRTVQMYIVPKMAEKVKKGLLYYANVLS